MQWDLEDFPEEVTSKPNPTYSRSVSWLGEGGLKWVGTPKTASSHGCTVLSFYVKHSYILVFL